MNAGAVVVAALAAALGAACARTDVYPITGPAGDAGTGAAGGGTGGGGAAGAAAIACPSSVLPPGDTTHTIQVAGDNRGYVLHVPAAYDGKRRVPLVVDFHGVGGTGSSERDDSPYPPVLDPEGVIMAFPDGLRGPAGTAWDVGPCCVADVDDVAFARALVAEVAATACIDAARVYAVGVLTGGGMAHRVACQAADIFAAAAPAAFDLLEENLSECVPQRPITVISFRGTAADSRVPYTGGPSSLVPGMPVTFLGAQATFEAWARIDRCTGSRSAPDADGCSRYAGCQGGVEVILCTQEGARDEPGDATLAWPVLKRHSL